MHGEFQRKDPRALVDTSQILTCLSVLQSEEKFQSNLLMELIDARKPVLESLERIHSLMCHVESVLQDASLLLLTMENTAKTAERVSKRVQALDNEMGRVRISADFVGQVMELKSSLAALPSTIVDQDWEAASRLCARAMSLPSAVTESIFATMVVPTSEIHLPPAQTLQEARMNLLDTFRHKFGQASRSRDSTATSRFFKLFPAIGFEEEGLDAYASFVVDLVRIRVPTSKKTSSPLYYISTLTALFENMATIVDQHHAIVEKYYGPGKMRYVTKRLLSECDRVVKDVITIWEEDRAMKDKLSDTSNNQPALIIPQMPRRPNIVEDGLDPRDVDMILSELAGMIGRWNLFRKFLLESINDELPESYTISHHHQLQSTGFTADSSESSRHFDRLMTTYYMPLESWYIRTSILKAHRVSSIDLSQSIPATTAPDDVFYILKIVMSRLLSTGAFSRIEGTLEHVRDIIEQDYAGVIKRKLEDVYRNGMTSTSKSEKLDKDHRVAMITTLNDLDLSSTHMERLIHDLSGSETITQYFTEDCQAMMKKKLFSLSDLTTKFRAFIRSGVEQMFNQLVRPKLRTFILDIYKDISYTLDDEGYSAAEQQDAVRKRFIRAWEGFADGYQENFTQHNYRVFFDLVLDVVLKPWEKLITSLKFTELGAIRFDRDLRSILVFLASRTAFGDAREKFVRLQQISTLLNLDGEEDVDEFYNSSGITWKLSLTEARATAGLKM